MFHLGNLDNKYRIRNSTPAFLKEFTFLSGYKYYETTYFIKIILNNKIMLEYFVQKLFFVSTRQCW